MINLKTLLKNHFDNPQISDDELQKFSEDHPARISANNPGAFDEIVGQTGTAHIAYFGSIMNEDTAIAVRQGMTRAVDQAITSFKKLVQQKEGAIRSAFGEDSPEYQEFFPAGLQEYTKATKENIEKLIARITTATAMRQAALEPGLGVLFTLQRDQFKPLREAQLGKKGEVGDHKSRTVANRKALEWQLTANIHFIGFTFREDTVRCLAYFDQSFLRNHAVGEHGEEDEQPATLPI